MAKIRFTINKKTLVMEQGDGYTLTRVPQSNMEYYLLLRQQDILSDDGKTLVTEWESDQEMNVLSRTYDVEKDRLRQPTLKEAIAAKDDASASVRIKAEELYSDYYEYDENMDPEEREKRARIREQKRQEALERSGRAKRADRQNAKESSKQTAEKQSKGNNRKEQTTEETPQEERPKHYDRRQFREIKKGIQRRLNTEQYADINFSAEQMRELRLAMQAGVNVTKYNNPVISAEHMKELRLGAANGVELDLGKLDQTRYNAEQIRELRIGFEKKLNVNKFLNPAYDAAQMRELRIGQQAGLDTSSYENPHYSAEQMITIRHQLVLQNIREILKRLVEDIRLWITEKAEQAIEKMKASYQKREPMTKEQIKEARMNEAVKDIKETLIQSELLPESAYQDKELDQKIRERIEELAAFAERHPEKDMEQEVNRAAQDVCEEAGADMQNTKAEKVVEMQSREEVKTLDEAVEEALEEAEQMEEVLEEESWEMMQ
ncbi:MAG: hypothetical protein NC300_12545 [Bacteroidales bacterium]|nr:hypothetical protein [Clostridium sp.]MCM1204963.1 hypothetical protein [Bacteroidales bacterium]